MGIDIERERLISFAAAAKLFPAMRSNRPVSTSTIWRWCQEGGKLPGGQRLKLESVRVVGRHMTSVEAVHRFLAAQNPTADANQVAGAATTNDARTAALDHEEQQVRELLAS